MKKIQINCNTNGKINIDDDARINGISIALINEKGVPVARYEFENKKTSNIIKLTYEANNVRIHFYDDITPTTLVELTSSTYDK